MAQTEQNKTVKRSIAEQLHNEAKRQGITKQEMAKRMKTSRAALDRVLKDDTHNISLRTLCTAAAVLGLSVHISLE